MPAKVLKVLTFDEGVCDGVRLRQLGVTSLAPCLRPVQFGCFIRLQRTPKAVFQTAVPEFPLCSA